MTPEDVSDLVKESGLSGRGGAFFPTGLKWQFVRGDPKTPRYVVINGDESEPGTYVNRYSLELDPHLMLEGMLIAAYACNATLGYVYIRGEYGLSHERTQAAIREAYEAGYLGSDILGKAGFDFEVTFRRGAGAYIVGEETALFNSLEGKRGNPRYKPPFPTNVGVWGLPTAINNVETLSAAPAIIQNGAEWFQNLGHGDATGTKMYCLSGRVAKPGVHELPLGTTARRADLRLRRRGAGRTAAEGLQAWRRIVGGTGSAAPGRRAGTAIHGGAGHHHGYRRRGGLRRHGLHGGRRLPRRALLRRRELRVLHSVPRRRGRTWSKSASASCTGRDPWTTWTCWKTWARA